MKPPFLCVIDRRVWPGVILISMLALLTVFLFQSFGVLPIFLFFLFLHIAFFRDPFRRPRGEGVLAPADGKVVEISLCDEPRFLGCQALKIGIFLSVLDVHVNRMPWAGTLEWQEYTPGKFLNAMEPESAIKNESNWLGFRNGTETFIVRQISGLIARHIHWDIQQGERLGRGDKIGVICYGSRTEIYLPAARFEATVKLGDAVKSSETVLGNWKGYAE
ncbi:MAG TPA: phosphatidylserine decarboxylase family protein [Candidatus Omnitrophica bacterium]|nr:phosphatidylserine decarboxylase family protein [Candidatus Omnitrophota bacterium]